MAKLAFSPVSRLKIFWWRAAGQARVPLDQDKKACFLWPICFDVAIPNLGGVKCGQFRKVFVSETRKGFVPWIGVTALVRDVCTNGNGRTWAFRETPELPRKENGHLLRMPLALVVSPITRLTVAPRRTSVVAICGGRGI